MPDPSNAEPSEPSREPNRLEVLGAFIRDQRRQTRLSMRKLAEAAGVSNPYLSQIERGLRRPSAEILQQLAGALSISAESLYVRAGFLDDDGDTVDVATAILRDPHLAPDQRHTMLQVYRALRAEAGTPLGPVDGDTRSDGDGGPVDSDDPESTGPA